MVMSDFLLDQTLLSFINKKQTLMKLR